MLALQFGKKIQKRYWKDYSKYFRSGLLFYNYEKLQGERSNFIHCLSGHWTQRLSFEEEKNITLSVFFLKLIEF